MRQALPDLGTSNSVINNRAAILRKPTLFEVGGRGAQEWGQRLEGQGERGCEGGGECVKMRRGRGGGGGGRGLVVTGES